jgi:hypothetical protein
MAAPVSAARGEVKLWETSMGGAGRLETLVRHYF